MLPLVPGAIHRTNVTRVVFSPFLSRGLAVRALNTGLGRHKFAGRALNLVILNGSMAALPAYTCVAAGAIDNGKLVPRHSVYTHHLFEMCARLDRYPFVAPLRSSCAIICYF